MNRPHVSGRALCLASLVAVTAGCAAFPQQQGVPGDRPGVTETRAARDEVRAASAGTFSVDLALGVPTVRKAQGLASDLGIGKVIAGVFDFGTSANEVARLGWYVVGSYQNGSSASQLQSGTYDWFSGPHAAALPAILGTPSNYGSTRQLTDSLAGFAYLDLGNSNKYRIEPRRYMIRDFLDGESLLQSGGSPSYLRFGNLAADDGSGAHRYLVFAVAWDAHPDATKRKVLGYTDAIVSPLAGASPIALNLVLDEGVSTDRTQVGVTLDPVVPAIEDCSNCGI